MSFFMDLITGSAKDLHTIVALGRHADTCATKNDQSSCDAVTECSWTSGTSLCDVADATVKSVVGVETLTGVFSTWNTCQKLGTGPEHLRSRHQLQVGQNPRVGWDCNVYI